MTLIRQNNEHNKLNLKKIAQALMPQCQRIAYQVLDTVSVATQYIETKKADLFLENIQQSLQLVRKHVRLLKNEVRLQV